MCTAFIHKGADVIFGFNMDINEGAFPYDVYATEDWFGVGTPADLDAFSGQPEGPALLLPHLGRHP